MAQSYTVNIYVAAPGTPLKAGGTSLPGHMYYATETQGKNNRMVLRHRDMATRTARARCTTTMSKTI